MRTSFHAFAPAFAGVLINFVVSPLCIWFSPYSSAQDFPPVIGVSGTPEDDVITQTSSVEAVADEEIDQAGLLDVSAIGIDALTGNDSITTEENGTITADVDADGLAVLVNFGLGTESSAVGIDAGPDEDEVAAGAPIVVTSDAVTDAGTANFFFDPLLSFRGFTATAQGTGIAGGMGFDGLVSDTPVSVEATADAHLVSLTLTPVQLPADVFGLGLTPTTADALAIGLSADAGASTCSPVFVKRQFHCLMDASAGEQALENHDMLAVTALAKAKSDLISVELLGKERAYTSTEAAAAAAGLFGGVGNDPITNTGPMDIDSLARSHSVSADVKFGALPIPDVTPPAQLLELFGAAINESNTIANALAIGIDAGDGDDTVINSGTSGYIGDGPAHNLPSPLPPLPGSIFAGPLDDYCQVDSTADVCAQAIALSTKLRFDIPAPPLPKSSAIAASPGVTEATTTSSADGAAGDELSISEMDTRAQAYAGGIAGGEGKDAITNSSPFAVETYAFSKSESVSFTLGLASGWLPVSVNVPVAKGKTGAEAETFGLTGDGGNDRIDNTDELGVLSTAKATSSSVALGVQAGEKGIAAGIGIADGSTVGTAFAAGIDGGGGVDDIDNSGVTSAEAHSEVITTSISVTVSGVGTGFAGAASLTSADSAAHAESVGIDGGKHESSQGAEGDTIDNEGVIEATAGSISISKSVSVSAAFAKTGVAVGTSLADSNTTAQANATGIRTDAGEDTVTSQGEADAVSASSEATAASNSVAVTLSGSYEGLSLGVSAARAVTEALATAAGIDTGAGDDIIDSDAHLKSDAQANSTANARSVTISIAPVSFGAALAEVGAVSEATSVGISSGDGKDDVTTHGVIDVDATATTNTVGEAFNFSLFGVGSVDLTSTAITHATGLDGGAGPDSLTNTGEIDVDATSTIDALGASGNLIGRARADLLLDAEATAFGIIAGDGSEGASVGNSIFNSEGASIDVTATARSYADSYAVIGGGFASAKAGSTTKVVAAGVLGGLGNDSITNKGELDVTADSVNSAISFGFTGVGFQTIDADISAEATASGIDAGEGENVITNSKTGAINVHANVENLAGSVGAGILDFTFTSADASAEVAVSGIRSGAGVDSISNEGDIVVSASIFNDAAAGTIGLFAFSDTENLSSATLEGINAGGGDDFITNSGTLTVGEVVASFDPDKCLDVSIACARAATVAFDAFSFVDTRLKVSARLTGISGGDGNDTIANITTDSGRGDLTVGDPDDWMVISETDSITSAVLSFFELSLAIGTADLESIGIEGGEGDDVVSNSADVTVHARVLADVYSMVEIDFFGATTSRAVSDAQTTASAIGIAGNAGDDDLDNSGTLTVKAHSKNDVSAVTEVGIAGANSTVTSNTDATAIGMDGGSGSNTLTNSTDGVIVVESVGETDASPKTTTGAFVLAKSAENYISINSDAWGMRAGVVDDEDTPWLLGDDVLENMGDMTVTARAGESGVLSMDAFAEDVVEVGPALGDNASEIPDVGNPGVKMYAFATGINSGAGQDEVHNAKTIEVNALSYAWGEAETDSADITRNDSADISILSSATAIGLSAAGEKTLFTNKTDTATLTVTAKATGNADALSDGNLDARSDAWMSAKASATGVLAEEGYATIDNVGTVEVVAQAEPDSYAYASEGGAQYGESRASGIADAWAAGFKVGDSGSSINNGGAVNVTATAGKSGTWVSSAADEKAKSNGEAEAAATGILTGGGYNEIANQRALTVEANARTRVFADDVGTGDPDVLVARASATASATGISAGAVEGNDVGNLIWNFGDIEVSATADASYSLGSDADSKSVSAEAQSSSVGIETGGGDDIVYNAGSISTFEKVKEQGVVKRETAGTAITTGAGRDEVYLLGDSLTDGRILLGAGGDLIAFQDFAQLLWTENGSSAPGIVNGGDGIDTLRIEDRNSFTIAPPTSIENLEIDQGQLVIDGNYPLPEDGLLQVEIYNPGVGDLGYGQLTVAGSATLDGSLSVVALPRLYRDAETFDVMTANWISPASDFAEVKLPDPTPLLSLNLTDPRPIDQIVRIEASVEPFGTAARYPLYMTIGEYLDQIAPATTGDLASLLGAFQLTPEPGIDAAFASFSPDSYQALSSLTTANSVDYMRSLQRQMLALRGPMMSVDFVGLGGELAFNGNAMSANAVDAREEPVAAATHSGHLFSLNGFVVSGEQDASKGYAGYDYFSSSVSLSAHLVRESFLAGANFGISRTEVDFSDGRGDGSIHALHAGLFGSLYNENAYIEAGLGYSRQDYEVDRNLRVGDFRGTAEGEYHGDVVQGFLGAGYTFKAKSVALQPFASMYYTWLDEGGTEETGADDANLKVEGETTESLIGEVGMRVSKSFDGLDGELDLDLSIGVNHDFGIDDRKVTAGLLNAPGTSFTIDDRDLEATSAVFGAGLTFRRHNTMASLLYRGQFNGDRNSHAIMATVGIKF